MPRPVTSVALDLLTLVPGGMGGTETYARELITHLAKDDTLRLSAVLPRSARGFTQGRIRETVIESVPGGASTRERLERVLISLGRDELSDMIEKEHGAELTCHFCNKKYSFSEAELKGLLEEAGKAQ